MGILEDVMKALERIPSWKRLQNLPTQVEELERRINALESRLNPATGEQCPSCRAMAFKLLRSEPAPEPWGSMGVRQDHFACSACPYTDIRERNPG